MNNPYVVLLGYSHINRSGAYLSEGVAKANSHLHQLELAAATYRTAPLKALEASNILLSNAKKEWNTKASAQYLLLRASCCHILSNYSDAYEYSEKAVRMFRHLKNRIGLSIAFYKQAGISIEQGDRKSAIELAKESLQLQDHIKNHRLTLNTLGVLQSAYRLSGHYCHSCEISNRILSLAKRAGDQNQSAIAYDNIANIYYSLGEMPLARFHNQKCIELYEICSDKSGLANAYALQGLLLLKQGFYVKALATANRALVLQNELCNQQGIATSLLVRSDSRVYTGDVDGALHDSIKALAIANEINNNDLKIQSNLQLGKLYYGIGAAELAIEYLMKALAAAKKNNAHTFLPEILTHLSTIAQDKREYRQAYAYLSEGTKVSNEFQRTSLPAVLNLQYTFENEKLLSKTLDLPKASGDQLSSMVQVAYNIKNNFKTDSSDIHTIEQKDEFDNYLRVLFPSLGKSERQLCVLLRNKSSSKEIAIALAISPKTVENHRFRIRKKLGLSRGENLSDCIYKLDRQYRKRTLSGF